MGGALPLTVYLRPAHVAFSTNFVISENDGMREVCLVWTRFHPSIMMGGMCQELTCYRPQIVTDGELAYGPEA